MPQPSALHWAISSMINLIPSGERKKKVRDFYFRLTATTFIVVGSTILVAAASILPAYFLSSVKKNFSASKLETQKGESILLPDEATLETAKDLDKKMALVEKLKGKSYLLSEKVVNAILLEKMTDIKITKIKYDIDPKGVKAINISGTAPSRERLLSFRRALEQNTSFKKVDLPISNFVKGTNITFSMIITPA